MYIIQIHLTSVHNALQHDYVYEETVYAIVRYTQHKNSNISDNPRVDTTSNTTTYGKCLVC